MIFPPTQSRTHLWTIIWKKIKVDPLEVESSRTESRLRGATFPDKSAAALFTSQRSRRSERRGVASRSGNTLHRCSQCSNRRCQPIPPAMPQPVRSYSHHIEIAADPARLPFSL